MQTVSQSLKKKNICQETGSLQYLVSDISWVNCCCLWLQNPAELDDWLADLNPNSREVITDAYAVPPLKHAKEGDRFQFERLGEFFSLDFPS